MISSFAARGLVTVQASPAFPWEPITLHATVTLNPYWGRCGGYHDIWASIKTELAKIGINLVVDCYDDFTWWGRVWGWTWNKPWDQGGWDLTCLQWWMMPTGLIRLEPLVHSWLIPKEGYNVFPYNDSKSDELLWKGMHTLDATERRYYLWKWQEELMHDPPMINLYYPRLHEVTTVWLEGWDPVVRFRDVSHLAINETLFAERAPEWRKTQPSTLTYAVSEEVWNLYPLWIKTAAEEVMCGLQFETLYDLSIDPWPPMGQEPAPWDFCVKPTLAADYPEYLRKTPEDPVGTRVRVPLRQGVKWSDFDTSGQYLDAEDVKNTFELILDPDTDAVAHGDIVSVIESVEIVNDTCVDFILYEPYTDFATLLSNERGLAIAPHHIIHIHPIKPCDPWWYEGEFFPVTGPFKLEGSYFNTAQIVPGDFALLERNPLYFGYNLGWGPDESIQAVYLKWISDPAVGLREFQTYRLDLGEYPTAPVEVWQSLAMDPNLNVFQYDYPASNPILLNFNNPYLSNRYIRLAIAHAIPYERIFSEILTSWGIEGYPGKTLITPIHYYTDPDNVTVHLFNEELEPYHYDIEEALDYMEMWWYSTNQPYTDGPVGDSDLSGLVNLDDFLVWRANTETDPSITWPQEVVPGNIIDPDFNNDNNVDPAKDFPLWAANYGEQYPFPGAR